MNTKPLIAILMLSLSNAGIAKPDISSVRGLVVSSEGSGCGSHVGSFTIQSNHQNVEIHFEHNPNAANPVSHPIKVIWNGKPLRSWSSLLCGFPSQDPLVVGSYVTVHGVWVGMNAFEAYTIEVIQNWKPSFDCSKASLPDEFYVCFNKELAEADLKIDRLYKRKLTTTDKHKTTLEQRTWLSQTRDNCVLDLACLKKSYAERVKQLEN